VRNNTFGMSLIARFDRSSPMRNGYLRDNGIIPSRMAPKLPHTGFRNNK